MGKKIVLNLIGLMLKKRKRSNLWLAEEIGVSKDTVSRWVRNEQQPHLLVLFDISVLLECDIRELIVSTKGNSSITRQK